MIFHDFKIRGDQFTARNCPNHYNYKLKWASRNSSGIPGISSGNQKKRNSNPTHLMHRGPGLR